jgi:hypothetical protein
MFYIKRSIIKLASCNRVPHLDVGVLDPSVKDESLVVEDLWFKKAILKKNIKGKSYYQILPEWSMMNAMAFPFKDYATAIFINELLDPIYSGTFTVCSYNFKPICTDNIPSHNDVENLKTKWLNRDVSIYYEIEKTPGFEIFYQDLLRFRNEQESLHSDIDLLDYFEKSKPIHDDFNDPFFLAPSLPENFGSENFFHYMRSKND